VVLVAVSKKLEAAPAPVALESDIPHGAAAKSLHSHKPKKAFAYPFHDTLSLFGAYGIIGFEYLFRFCFTIASLPTAGLISPYNPRSALDIHIRLVLALASYMLLSFCYILNWPPWNRTDRFGVVNWEDSPGSFHIYGQCTDCL
jgi:hypothetical protein